MARIETGAGIRQITGIIDKSARIVSRVKKFRDPLTGEVIGYGPNEYYILRPKSVGPSLSQRQHTRKFGKASLLMKEIVANKQHPRYMEMYNAFMDQLNSENAIKKFTNFVCSVLYWEM